MGDLFKDIEADNKNPPISKTWRFIKKFRKYFHEYCDQSSIHGFRYLSEKRTLFEKIWWIIVFILCNIALIFSIIAVYKRWDASPVIVTFSNKPVPLYEIPFPAITICSEAKVKQNVFNYTRALNSKLNGIKLNDTDERMLAHLQYLCPPKNATIFNQTDGKSFLETLEAASPVFSLENCELLGFSGNCNDYFKKIITDEGICYTANILTRTQLLSDSVVHYGNYHEMNRIATNWSMERGYTKKAEMLDYPVRALLHGARYGLQFEVKSPKEVIDYQCRGSLTGFRVLLHSAIRLPCLNMEYIRTDLDTSSTIMVHPSIISTSDSVKVYPPEKRMCYFTTERRLKYFKIYSSNNCKLECLANITLALCNCVPFYMPRENGTRICGGSDYECTRQAECINIDTVHSTISSQDIEKKMLLSKAKSSCSCYPICSDIDYGFTLSQTTWDWQAEKKSDTTDFHLTKFSIYFTKSEFIVSQRSELYGPIDFLANFGGLLGLFAGVSIFSFVELIYFLTLRFVSNKNLFGSWAGPKN